MDGASLLYKLREVLQEDSTSTYLDTRTSYDYLYEAAKEYFRKVKHCTDTQSITTVEDQEEYDLDAEFLEFQVMDRENRYVVKWYDGSAYNWIPFRESSATLYANNTTSVSLPDSFYVRTKQSLTDRITGTATSAGAASYGECTLTDSTAPFANVKVADTVHNTTDGSSGLVIAVTSTSALVTALFGGTDNDWTSSDAYIIVPQAKKQIVFDPPPADASCTITVPYVTKPTPPVYSSYRTYNIDPLHEMALVMYAAWLYKYRDREPNFGDAWYKYFEMATRKALKDTNLGLVRKGFRVNMIKRSYGDRSYR
ncbi:MAG: hypothetical protein WC455_18740 [Dehalococcoidia bacterium]|jgi:hypothetical protein